ncbi:hypothetical protein HUU05_11310, partial [candidate division KSB1 bacterium]|nr:hypothetical protein [candidate division KSB1 bacterium]
LKQTPPEPRELQRVLNQYEANFLSGLEVVSAKADRLNSYYKSTGNPDYFNEDLARYQALEPEDIRTAALTYLPNHARVVLSIVPQGKVELASGEVKKYEPKKKGTD